MEALDTAASVTVPLVALCVVGAVVVVLVILGVLNLRDKLRLQREERLELEYIDTRLTDALVGWDEPL